MNNITRLRKLKNLPLLLLLVVLGLFVTACGSGHDSWAGITQYSQGEEMGILVSYRRQVISLRPDNSVRWIYEGEGDTDFYASAIVDEDRFYVGDYKGRVHAVDLASGKNIWTYEEERTRFLFITIGSTDRVLAPITLGQVQGQKALFFGNEHGVSALVDIDTNAPRIAWDFETEHSVWGQPLYLTVSQGIDGFALPDLQLIVGSLDKHLYSLNPDTGEQNWKLDLAGAIVSPPTYDPQRQRLYVGTLDSEVYAISVTGQIIGRFETNGWVWGSPTLYKDSIYVTDLTGWLYELALHPASELNSPADQGFREAWSVQLTDEDLALRPSPTIYEPLGDPTRPILLVGSEDHFVYAIDLFDPNGRSIKWRQEVEDETHSQIVVVNQPDGDSIKELVIVSTYNEDNLIVALRLDNGDQEWAYQYED